MTELHTLLDRSVDHPVELDTVADVRRGHAALGRRRRRTGLATAAVAAAVAVVGSQTMPPGHLLGTGPSGEPSAPTESTRYFTFPEPPEGWSVQASDESLVVIAPDGLPKVDLKDPHLSLRVMGKLAIEYEDAGFEPPKEGAPIAYDGREFYDVESDGQVRQVSVRVSPGAWLVVQEAPSLHWTVPQMIEFLDRVEVAPGAIPGG